MRSAIALEALKQTARGFGLTVLAIGAGLAISCLIPRRWHQPPQTNCDFKIYVASDGFHVSLIVPVTNEAFDWQQHLPLQEIGRQNRKDYRYLSFGWGERFFFMETPSWDKVNPLHALKALVLLNPSVMNVQGYPEVPQTWGSTVVKTIRIDREHYLQLNQFIEASFQTDAQGRKIRARVHEGSSFYEANGKYSLLRTCNTWAAEGLDAAALQTPLWSGLAWPIMLHLKSECKN
ncbi:hypothetical protein BST81_04170 [Leptolyngbya sp. 'hensonii']|uniref:TIGR02117 family protein n=1 Tax=Leptolyngbya sp. 'hensonii' TaxID=1922337 RepID=UPI00094F5EE3|nr:TIGR02117 family protein [Leptolyngbya sp. 'hensonii']OLP19737.1 hypothetical protein BST81_04170 [Leptolyngbya sp. 'hensonii']